MLILLSKFDLGRNYMSRIEISQNNPRFDYFLQMILGHTNKITLAMLQNNLQLNEHNQQVQNNFLIKLFHNKNTGGIMQS